MEVCTRLSAWRLVERRSNGNKCGASGAEDTIADGLL